MHDESLCPTESCPGKIILRSDQRRRKINLGVMKCWGIVVFSSRRGWGRRALCHFPGCASVRAEVAAVRMRRAELEVDREVQETERVGAGEPLLCVHEVMRRSCSASSVSAWEQAQQHSPGLWVGLEMGTCSRGCSEGAPLSPPPGPSMSLLARRRLWDSH